MVADGRATLHVDTAMAEVARAAAKAEGESLRAWVEAAIRGRAELEASVRGQAERGSSQVFLRFEEEDR